MIVNAMFSYPNHFSSWWDILGGDVFGNRDVTEAHDGFFAPHTDVCNVCDCHTDWESDVNKLQLEGTFNLLARSGEKTPKG